MMKVFSRDYAQAQKDEHRPFRILLVREGENEATWNPQKYNEKPDAHMRLTPRGQQMAEKAGEEVEKLLKKLYPDAHHPPRVVMWVSPFYRTRETAAMLLKGMPNTKTWVSHIRESPLLVEQDWGLFESLGKDEMKIKYPEEYKRLTTMNEHQGQFWVRFPLGESHFDVCQRVQILFSSIVRDRLGGRGYRRHSRPTDVVIVVSHPVPITSFLMMWCHRTIEWFRNSLVVPFCSVRMIDNSHDFWDAGFVFGGWLKENLPQTGLNQPVNPKTLNKPEEVAALGRMRMRSWVQRTDSMLKNKNELEKFVVWRSGSCPDASLDAQAAILSLKEEKNNSNNPKKKNSLTNNNNNNDKRNSVDTDESESRQKSKSHIISWSDESLRHYLRLDEESQQMERNSYQSDQSSGGSSDIKLFRD